MSSSMGNPPSKPSNKTASPLRTFKVTSKPAETTTERDDMNTIHGVRSAADLSREVLKRLTPTPPETS